MSDLGHGAIGQFAIGQTSSVGAPPAAAPFVPSEASLQNPVRARQRGSLEFAHNLLLTTLAVVTVALPIGKACFPDRIDPRPYKQIPQSGRVLLNVDKMPFKGVLDEQPRAKPSQAHQVGTLGWTPPTAVVAAPFGTIETAELSRARARSSHQVGTEGRLPSSIPFNPARQTDWPLPVVQPSRRHLVGELGRLPVIPFNPARQTDWPLAVRKPEHRHLVGELGRLPSSIPFNPARQTDWPNPGRALWRDPTTAPPNLLLSTLAVQVPQLPVGQASFPDRIVRIPYRQIPQAGRVLLNVSPSYTPNYFENPRLRIEHRHLVGTEGRLPSSIPATAPIPPVLPVDIENPRGREPTAHQVGTAGRLPTIPFNPARLADWPNPTRALAFRQYGDPPNLLLSTLAPVAQALPIGETPFPENIARRVAQQPEQVVNRPWLIPPPPAGGPMPVGRQSDFQNPVVKKRLPLGVTPHRSTSDPAPYVAPMPPGRQQDWPLPVVEPSVAGQQSIGVVYMVGSPTAGAGTASVVVSASASGFAYTQGSGTASVVIGGSAVGGSINTGDSIASVVVSASAWGFNVGSNRTGNASAAVVVGGQASGTRLGSDAPGPVAANSGQWIKVTNERDRREFDEYRFGYGDKHRDFTDPQ